MKTTSNNKNKKVCILKTRSVYYCGINGKAGGYIKNAKKTLAFVKKAAASLVDEKKYESFLGIEITKEIFFQMRIFSEKKYYAELGENTPDGLIYKYINCNLEKLHQLIEAAWKSSDKKTFMANAPKMHWATKRAVHYTQPEPSDPEDDIFEIESSPAVPDDAADANLGHGNHWRALSDVKDDIEFEKEWDEQFIPLLKEILEKTKSKDIHAATPPWREGEKEFIQYEWKTDSSVNYIKIEHIETEKKQLLLKTVFPSFVNTCKWILELDSVSRAYGDCEGLIRGHAATGHPLEWFAPDFLRYAHDWKKLGIVQVNISGLALKLEPLDAKPIEMTEGTHIEFMREQLRQEGKTQEAEELKSVTVVLDQMRTLYSNFHDHASVVGKIMSVRKIKINHWREISGYLLEIEAMPEKLATGYVLPVYAFSAALGDYIPKRGDFVVGNIWLQGKYFGEASPEEKARFWKNKRPTQEDPNPIQRHLNELIEKADKLMSRINEFEVESGEVPSRKMDALDKVTQYYEEASELAPDLVELYLKRGEILDQLYDDGLECFNKAIELDPNCAEAYIKKGRHMSCEPDRDKIKVLAYFDKAIEINPNLYEAYLGKAIQLDYVRRYDEAIVCYDKALELYQKDNAKNARHNVELLVWMLKRKRETLGTLGKLEEAIACYDLAESYRLPDEFASFSLSDANVKGWALAELGREAECMAFYDSLISRLPKNERISCYHAKGYALDVLGKRHEALACYEAAIAEEPQNASLYYDTANLLSAWGDYPGALLYLEKTIFLSEDGNDSKSKAIKAKGKIFRKQGRLEDAVACYALVALDTEDRSEKFEILKSLGRIDEALAVYADDEFAFERGVVLASLGRHEEAIISFAKELALHPHNSQALRENGKSLAVLGREKEAIQCGKKILKNDSVYYGSYLHVGEILLSLRREEEAVSHFLKAIKIYPEIAEDIENIHDGISESALPYFQKAIEKYRQSQKT